MAIVAFERFLSFIRSDNTPTQRAAEFMEQATDEINAGGHRNLDQIVIDNVTNVDFVNNIDNVSDEYEIHIINLIQTTNNEKLFMRISTDGGATYESGASDYDWTMTTITGSTSTTFGDTADSEIHIVETETIETSNGGLSGIIRLYAPSSTTTDTYFDWNVVYQNSSNNITNVRGAAAYKSTNAVDAVRLFMSSGNIVSGNTYLYEWKRN